MPLLLLTLTTTGANGTNDTFASGFADIASGPGFISAESANPQRLHLQPVAEPLDGSIQPLGAASATASFTVLQPLTDIGTATTARFRLSSSLSASTAYSYSRSPAVDLSAFVLTPSVYPDSALVRVALQARDAQQQTRTSTTTLFVKLSPDATLRAVENTEPTATCSPNASTGACIATLTVPISWLKDRTDLDFESNNGALNSSAGRITVLAGLTSAAVTTTVGSVAVHAQPAFPTFSSILGYNSSSTPTSGSGRASMFVALPLRPLFAGETFDLTVHGLANATIGGFRFRINSTASASLQIQSITVNTNLWAGDSAINANMDVAAGSFFLSNANNVPSNPGPDSLQTLATVRVKVGTTAGIGYNRVFLTANLTFEAIFMSDADSTVLISDTQPQGMVLSTATGLVLPWDAAPGSNSNSSSSSSSSSTTSSTTTSLSIADSQVVRAVFLLIAEPVVFNTAVLTGVNQTIPLTVLTVTAGATTTLQTTTHNSDSGRISLSCSAVNNLVVEVDALCTRMMVTTAGLEGDARQSIRLTLRYGAPPSAGSATVVSTTAAAVIWFPENMQIVLSPSTVKPIENWLRPDISSASACASASSWQYQVADVRVLANFRTRVIFAGGETGPLVDITNLVSHRLSVLSGGGAGSGSGRIVPNFGSGGCPGVQGLSAGTASVRLVDPRDSLSSTSSRYLAAATLTMSSPSSSVAVASITSVVISRVSLTATSASGSSRSTNITFVATVERDTLSFEGQKAYVVAQAQLSDGSHMNLPLAANDRQPSIANLSLVTLSPTNIVSDGYDSLTVVTGAVGLEGDLASLTWTASTTSGACATKVVASGFVSGRVSLPAARSATLAVGTSRLTPSDDGAAAAGLPTQTTLTARLQYPDGRNIDVSLDNRTEYHIVEGDDLVEVIITTSAVVVRPLTTASFGSSLILVNFTHQNVTASVQVSVVRGMSLSVQAHSYPTYTGSSAVSVTQLRPIAGTNPVQYQAAVFSVDLLLSDATTVSVTSRSQLTATVNNGSVSLTRPSSSGSAFVVGVASSTPIYGMAELTFSLSQLNNDQQIFINVSSTPVRVTALTVMALDAGATLRGLANQANSRLRLGAIFEDGTRYTTLFPGTTTALPGLISFASSDSTAASVSNNVVTLLANSARLITLTASVDAAASASGNSLTSSLDLACNLDPAGGDVDMGASTGLPLAETTVGMTLSVPVRVNTDGKQLGAYDLRFLYDSASAEVITVQQNAQGIFDFRVDPDNGEVSFGGTVASGQGQGSQLLLATIQIKVLATGELSFGGLIVTLGEDNIDGSPIGSGQQRPFLAGNITVIVTGSGRRRAVVVGHDRERTTSLANTFSNQRRRRAVVAGDFSAAPGPAGDTNGDGKFDVNDVKFVSTYLANALQGFTGAVGQDILARLTAKPWIYKELDADLNNATDEVDALYLNRINFGLLRFVRTVQVADSAGSAAPDCGITFGFELLRANSQPAISSSTRLYVLLQDGSTAASDTLAALAQSASANISLGRYVGSMNLLRGGQPSSLGAVLEAVPVGNATWAVRMPFLAPVTDAGLTVVQMVPGSLPTSPAEYRFLTRSSLSPRYSGQIAMYLPSFNSAQLRVMTQPASGYSPLATFSVTDTVAVCRRRFGQCQNAADCATLTEHYLVGDCTLTTTAQCIPCRNPCDISMETELVPCTSTSDRVCARLETTMLPSTVDRTTDLPTAEPEHTSQLNETTNVEGTLVETTVETTVVPTTGNETAIETSVTLPFSTLLPTTTPTTTTRSEAAGGEIDGSASRKSDGFIGGTSPSGSAGIVVAAFLVVLLVLIIIIILQRRRRGRDDIFAKGSAVEDVQVAQMIRYNELSVIVPTPDTSLLPHWELFEDKGTLSLSEDGRHLIFEEGPDLEAVVSRFPSLAAVKVDMENDSVYGSEDHQVLSSGESIRRRAAASDGRSEEEVPKSIAVRYYAAVGDAAKLQALISLNHLLANGEAEAGTDMLSPLLVAARFGQKETVSVLINNGASTLGQSPRTNSSVLHMACAAGSLDSTNLLLRGVAMMRLIDVHQVEALHVAAWTSGECLQSLLAAGCDCNCVTEWGATPLMLAAANNNVAGVKALLARGCNVMARDHYDRTALHYCCAFFGSTSVVSALLQAAEAHIEDDDRDKFGMTPLDYARERREDGLATMLDPHFDVTAAQGGVSVVALPGSATDADEGEDPWAEPAFTGTYDYGVPTHQGATAEPDKSDECAGKEDEDYDNMPHGRQISAMPSLRRSDSADDVATVEEGDRHEASITEPTETAIEIDMSTPLRVPLSRTASLVADLDNVNEEEAPVSDAYLLKDDKAADGKMMEADVDVDHDGNEERAQDADGKMVSGDMTTDNHKAVEQEAELALSFFRQMEDRSVRLT